LKLDATRHFEEISRIGRFVEGKVRQIRVKVKTAGSTFEILKRAKGLKECELYRRVFISPELTQKQRKVDKIPDRSRETV
jgi:hypothetical protein